MNFYRDVMAPGLFAVSADRSHALAHAALRWALPWRMLSAANQLVVDDERLKTRFAGIELPNPVGLAAGFDKNAELLEALSCLGFGFICVGSIMPEPRYGNPFPRLVRYRDRQSIADSMGVPSKGRDYAVARLRRPRENRVPVFANVGGFSAEEIAAGVLDVQPYVDIVEISLMCPNVLKAGEIFDEIGMLRGVLERIEGRAASVIVRVPNDTTQMPDRLAELIEVCIAAGIGGLKVGGGRRLPEPGLGSGIGTLHGRDIFEAALKNVECAAGFARGRIPIKGNGGISSAADVLAMRSAGATCVDLYSAFVYQGWTVARDINRQLAPLWSQPIQSPSISAAGPRLAGIGAATFTGS
jgi:dihydroorotate dehydrogenase (fumarate)/dihydroorotate dehydrogenase